MDKKEQILAMYIETARQLDHAIKAAEGTEQGSQERDHTERLFGERRAYGRILQELYGIPQTSLQRVLDGIYNAEDNR